MTKSEGKVRFGQFFKNAKWGSKSNLPLSHSQTAKMSALSRVFKNPDKGNMYKMKVSSWYAPQCTKSAKKKLFLPRNCEKALSHQTLPYILYLKPGVQIYFMSGTHIIEDEANLLTAC